MDEEKQLVGDQADAGPFSSALGGSPTRPVGILSTAHVNSSMYNMNHRYRGKCIIISNKVFNKRTGMNERKGTDIDAQNLKRVFRQFDFMVKCHEDCTVAQMEAIIKDASKENYEECDCFVFCLLTHGTNGYVYGIDGKYPTEKLFERFTGDKCGSLASKPKIFIIQACQGDKFDDGVSLRSGADQVDASDEVRIPMHADFLICSSTVPGFYSWRNTREGSWFIQSLCYVLEKYHDAEDLLSMLTIVNHRVAYYFESFVPQDPSMHMKKQIPCITSMLTRKIYLMPKY